MTTPWIIALAVVAFSAGAWAVLLTGDLFDFFTRAENGTRLWLDVLLLPGLVAAAAGGYFLCFWLLRLIVSSAVAMAIAAVVLVALGVWGWIHERGDARATTAALRERQVADLSRGIQVDRNDGQRMNVQVPGIVHETYLAPDSAVAGLALPAPLVTRRGYGLTFTYRGVSAQEARNVADFLADHVERGLGQSDEQTVPQRLAMQTAAAIHAALKSSSVAPGGGRQRGADPCRGADPGQ